MSAWFIEAGTVPSGLTLPFGVGADPNFYNAFNTVFSNNNDFYLQSSWNAAQNDLALGGQQQGQCVPYAQLTPNFPAPAKVDPNQLIGFDPSTTIATLTVAQYQWDFGDGSPTAQINCPATPEIPYDCNPSTFHGFTTPGTYNVTLTVTDFGGYTASVTKQVTVLGATPGGTGSTTTTTSSGSGTSAATSSSTTATSTSATSTSTATTSSVATLPPAAIPAAVPPAATEAIVTNSVSKAISGGLVVNYTATAGLAGRFQVLIHAKTAKKLHITGPVVKGLKINGIANPIQIGTALLVTQKSGGSHVAITLTAAAKAKLRHTKQLTLTVRLVARNVAGAQIVKTTTVKLG